MPVITPSSPYLDVEAMVVGHLAQTLGYEASTVRPDGFEQHLPYVQVTRIGGASTARTWQGRALQDEARLSLDVYAASREAAVDAVNLVRGAFEQMQGTSRNGGLVLRAWEETGPAVRPDEPNTNVTRIGLIVGLRVRPA